MPDNAHSILRLEVPVVVRLGERTMSLDEVVALTLGSIIEISKDSNAELDLMINNKVIGHGTAMKVGENFGLRITRLSRPAAGAAASLPRHSGTIPA